jgi:hypothetical protein
VAALAEYEIVASSCRQQRLRIMSMDAARRIRRKLKLLEIGVNKPKDFRVPADIAFWANPKERLNGTMWNFASGENGASLNFNDNKVTFSDKNMSITTKYNLLVRDDGILEVGTCGLTNGTTALLSIRLGKASGSMDITWVKTKHLIRPEIAREKYGGSLISGSLIWPMAYHHRTRKTLAD